MSILISIFILGYHGKTTDFAKNSSCHRTTIAHFLNSGKWDDSLLSDTLKCSVIEIIYSEAARTGKPVFCIVDDTIASKTKPSSRALHPIEDAYFHQSHLKGKQDYGHQAVAVMLSCNGIVLNYAFVMYNKSISKIDIVQSIAKELPVPPVMSYFLCDCWYVSEKIINTFAQRGFHTIGALKTNRLLYPSGMKKKLRELAAELSVTHREFDLVTVKKRNYYVYRYEGNLNGIENAVVLLSYPEKAFGNLKALRAFISTNAALSTQEILSWYVCRWGRLKYFSASVRRNWHWTAIRYALHRESKGTGYLCHWHISCVQWVLVGSVRLKLDITKSVIPFSWKSIVIFFNAQRKAMILIHL